MIFKKVKVLLLAVLVLVSALSLNFVAFATNDDEAEDDFVIETIITEEPTETEEDETTTKKPTTTAKPTTTRKPTTTSSYRPNNSDTVTTTEASDDDYSFTIKLELNNGEEALEIGVDEDGIVAVPDAPKKEGFKFDGWYSDSELTERWDFLTSKADEDTVLYAKWDSLPDDSLYSISVSTNLGGVITVTPNKAKAGERITITVKPDEGKQLVEGTLSVNGKFIEEYTFEMPANNVIVEAQFESVEVAAADENNQKFKDNLGKIITIAALVLVVLIVVIWLIVNRYRFLPDDEEDDVFFVEPMKNQPVIRHDDFVRTRRNQANAQFKDDGGDIDIINEAEIRKINKTGNINLDE